jgi:hypothetical protein
MGAAGVKVVGFFQHQCGDQGDNHRHAEQIEGVAVPKSAAPATPRAGPSARGARLIACRDGFKVILEVFSEI